MVIHSYFLPLPLDGQHRATKFPNPFKKYLRQRRFQQRLSCPQDRYCMFLFYVFSKFQNKNSARCVPGRCDITPPQAECHPQDVPQGEEVATPRRGGGGQGPPRGRGQPAPRVERGVPPPPATQGWPPSQLWIPPLSTCVLVRAVVSDISSCIFIWFLFKRNAVCILQKGFVGCALLSTLYFFCWNHRCDAYLVLCAVRPSAVIRGLHRPQ